MIDLSEKKITSESANQVEIASYSERFSEEIIIEISADQEDHCIIVLSNHLGRILRMMGVNVIQGKNLIHIENVNTLEAGIYQLCVRNVKSSILYSSILTKL